MSLGPWAHNTFLHVLTFCIVGKDMARDRKVIQKEVIDKFAQDLPQSYTVIVQHSDLSTITWAPLLHRFPWDIIFGNVSKGNITVAGDAMHPMTPDMGQMNVQHWKMLLFWASNLGN